MVSNASNDSDNGPVFIVGMNGSGTTMLLDHLNHHSRLFGFKEETRILPYYLKNASSFGDLLQDNNYKTLWKEMRTAFPFWKLNQKSAVPLPDNWRSLERTPAAVFSSILEYFAVQEGKIRWCEKTPMHVMHLELLHEHFPTAQFIHVIRDGRECAASFHRRWSYVPEDTIYRWKKVVRDGMRQGRQLPADRYHEVIFEKLTIDPEREMKKLCEFLNVVYEPSILQTSRAGPRMSGSTSTEIVPNSGKYKTYFDNARIRDLEQIGGDLLTKLGYSLESEGGDMNPGRLRLLFWSVQNHYRQGVIVIRKKVKSGRGKPWRMVYYRFKSAVQQKITNRF